MSTANPAPTPPTMGPMDDGEADGGAANLDGGDGANGGDGSDGGGGDGKADGGGGDSVELQVS